MARHSPFSDVGSLRPRSNSFDIHHYNAFDLDFGELVVADFVPMNPGDVFRMPTNVVGRLAGSLVAPCFAEFDIVLEAFFVSNRILMGDGAPFPTPIGETDFGDFLKGGDDGDTNLPLPVVRIRETPSGADQELSYFGVGEGAHIQPGVVIDPEDAPCADLWRAYRYIWNEFYRSEALQDEIQVCQWTGDGSDDDETFIPFSEYDQVLRRCWSRDYFTSSLPYQQFGTSPAFTLDGLLPLQFTDLNTPLEVTRASENIPRHSFFGFHNPQGTSLLHFGISNNNPNFPDPWQSGIQMGAQAGFDPRVDFVQGYVDLSDAVTFDISDFRTAFQVQKWKERTARAGQRYTELLRAHFGLSPRDEVLQRPYFISGSRVPWMISTVEQTSSSVEDEPLGTQGGQAIAVGRVNLGSYRAYEYGYVIVLASVLPKARYQGGMPRHFSRRSRLDFYWPEYGHLSEQAVKNKEIYISGDSRVDNATFGFQGIWNEFRYLPSYVGRHLRTDAPGYSMDYWHIGRIFQETPVLNGTFLTVGGSEEALAELHRIFQVTDSDENPFVLYLDYAWKANRPMPYLAEPGLVDHF